MKQFFKIMFATVAGFFFTFFIIPLLFILMAAIGSSDSDTETVIEDNSVLHVKFETAIKDRASESPLENFDFNTFESKKDLSLGQILKNIEKAKMDDRIKGIYLDLSTINAGMATIEEIRAALNDFKTSGKWIYSYSEIYTQGSYYLASVSDKVYLNPAGLVELRGLASQLMFFKNALEKLDIEVQIIRHGKFKSAVEPFMLEKMSESNREQMEKLLNTAWGSMINKISGSRKISVDEINNLADGIKIQNAKDALKYKFVDKLVYKDELFTVLKNKLKLEADDDINYISLNSYTKAKVKAIKKSKSKNKIAVIFAAGNIVSGKSDKDNMGSETISKAIREARLDKNVKAIVLRVNSPGGSALASDIMWREVVLAKKEKPVIVSMGDVAASGGYYIACAADKIVASEKTITGSIGVFGVIPNAQGFFNNKLGITFDTVKTNTHADMMTIFRPLTAEEKDIIQIGVENIYDDFITKVAAGRGMTKKQIDAIGQGRVWTGIDAKEIGLVDEIGGLKRAVEIAQETAKLEDYKLDLYPKRKDAALKFLMNLAGETEAKYLESKLGGSYKYYQKVEQVSTQSGIMARMPFDIEVH